MEVVVAMVAAMVVVVTEKEITAHDISDDQRRERERTFGEFLAPLAACQMPPPMEPMANAPPISSKILQGLRWVGGWGGWGE